jgi:thiamine-phosphate pyrophosphorylase
VLGLESFIDDAIVAGVDLLQIREPDLADDILVRLARSAVGRAAGQRTLIIVNDRDDIARDAGAHGVHLKSASAGRTSSVRATGPDWIVGRSVHDVGDLIPDEPVDYWMFGTMFPTVSKHADAPRGGVDGLARVVGASMRPVLAIGGVVPSNTGACLAAGASGVAAIGVFLPTGREPGSMGVAAAVAAFRDAMAGRLAPTDDLPRVEK